MRSLSTVAVAGSLVACANAAGSGAGGTPPTAITVDPQTFLGDVPCLDAPGALRTYVATLIDVSKPVPEAGFTRFVLPSSGPVSCQQEVRFERVVPGRQYAAEIDGYDRAGLEPLSAGSRVMLDPRTGEVVEPAWLSSCAGGAMAAPGGPDGGASRDAGILPFFDCVPYFLPDGAVDPNAPVCARNEFTLTMRGCLPLQPTGPTGVPTAIRVDTTTTLDKNRCSDAGGTIQRFEIRPADPALSAVTAPCGDVVDFAPLVGGTLYRFTVTAFVAGTSEPSFRTTCERVAVEGVSVRAACDPLRAIDRDAGRLMP